MTYKILETDPIRNIHKFFIDNIADLETLPKEPASTALVAATGDTYICNNMGTYVMYIDNPINNSGDEDNNNNNKVKYKLTGLLSEDVANPQEYSIHFKKCIVENNLVTLDSHHEEITTASAGALVAVVIEGLMPDWKHGEYFFIDGPNTDNLRTTTDDPIGTPLYHLEDTREYDIETGDRRGHYAEFYIMPPDDITVTLSIGEPQE